MPYKGRAKTEGGVYMPDDVVEREALATVVSYVIRVGPLAYKDKDKFGDGEPWCKEGDWVIFRSYSGTRVKIHDKEFRLINDDTVEAVVEDTRGVMKA